MSQNDFTDALQRLRDGEDSGVGELYPLVYDELKRLAQRQLGMERAEHTLQATALVHEVYLRMVDQTQAQWQDRSHFFALASQAIRRILVDHARHRGRIKRGGEFQRVEMAEVANLPDDASSIDLLELESALEALSVDHAEKVRIIEMRFFAGLTHEEIAEVMGISTRTVERHWRFARAWLYREFGEDAVG